VLKEAWAADNGFLASTLTLKRAAIEARYGKSTAEWSERLEKVVCVDKRRPGG